MLPTKKRIAINKQRPIHFYAHVFGGKIVRESGIGIVKLANTWIIVSVAGGPTDDKPEVYLSPPKELNQVQQFLNIRVANILEKYEEWKAKGAEFLTEPKDHGYEIRCYIRECTPSLHIRIFYATLPGS